MRALRTLLILAVVLGGIFVLVDRLAVNYAESEAADRIRLSQGTVGSKEVSIGGFPFLTQVLGKELDEVDVKLTDLQATAGNRPVRITEMNAALRDVKIGGNFSSAVAATATGTARISYADLSRAAEENITVAYGGSNKVKVTGSVTVLGRSLTRSVVSSVSLVDGSTIRVHADEVPGEGIPGLEDLVRKRTDFDRRIGGLPSGLKLTKVEPKPDGVEITVTGSNVVLAG
ncbi:DUF2993 domain-containing protein [Streptomyces sp. NPDC001941]|uniref:LmeA family phospholipid-binding protein n=1 Tax=Streptomyces sp. NPDC001941 TaxID=3154659 RepID=UPI00332B28ED